MSNSYNYFCNKRAFYEDDYEEPIWMRYKKEIWGKDCSQKFTEFERTHPELTLVYAEHLNKRIPVMGKTLFHADGQEYKELLYVIKKEGTRCYYEPTKELDDWLLMINEMTAWMKHRKLVRLCKLNPDMDLEQIIEMVKLEGK